MKNLIVLFASGSSYVLQNYVPASVDCFTEIITVTKSFNSYRIIDESQVPLTKFIWAKLSLH